MDPIFILILFIVVAFASTSLIMFVIWRANRAWGDFPQTPNPSTPQQRPWSDADADRIASSLPDEPPPTGGLQPILHPFVYQAATQALARGSANNPYAEYLVQRGDEIFINLDAITDLQQRQMIAQTIHSANRNRDADLPMMDMIRAFTQLGRRR